MESGPKSCKVNFNRNNEGGGIRSKVRKEKCGPKSCKVNFNRNNEGGRIRSKVRKEKYGGIDDDDDDESHMVFVL